jgi:hypothetical protein
MGRHVAPIGQKMDAYRLLVGTSERMIPLATLDINEGKILKWIIRKSNGVWTGLMRLRTGNNGGLSWKDNESGILLIG